MTFQFHLERNHSNCDDETPRTIIVSWQTERMVTRTATSP